MADARSEMDMTNKEIFSLYEGLTEISNDKELKFNIQTSFVLAKNRSILGPLYDAIIETRTKVLDKYGEPNDDGGWTVPKEKMADFMKVWDDFMEIDNLVMLQKIKLDDFKDEKIGIEIMEKLLPIIDK